MLILAAVIIFYLAIANLGSFFQLVASLRWSISMATWDRREDYSRLLATDFTPPISFIVPTGSLAGPAQAEHLDRLLSLRYPTYEVILVKDGVSEETPAVTGAFFMKRVDLRYRCVLATGEILTLYRSDDAKITLAEKEPGAWGDAVNCGLNLARYPLVCLLEPPALPHPENLLRVVKVLMETRQPIFQASGLVRAVNGQELEGLSPKQERLPAGRALRMFIAEQVAAQAGPALGLRRASPCPLPLKPLSLYPRSEFMAAGGCDAGLPRQLAEADLALRVFVSARAEKRDLDSFMLPGPVALGHMPESIGEQLRWAKLESRSRGEARARRRKSLRKATKLVERMALAFRRLFLQPAGAVEILSYLVLIPATALGALDPAILGVFLAVALGLPALTSVISVMSVQASFPLYPGAGLPLLLYAILSNLGYRQLVQVSTTYAALRRGR